MIRMAVLGCTAALSFTPVSVAAAPRTGQTAETTAEDIIGTADTENDTVEADGARGTSAWDAGETDSPDGAKDAEGADEEAGEADADGESEDPMEAGEDDGLEATSDTAGNAVDTGGQERKTAEQLRTEKGGSATSATSAADNEADLDEGMEDMEYDEDEEEEKPSYTAPEDSRHANVSFSFAQASASAYFSKLTYPLTLSLKEVDTGDRLTLTVKSEGQILEVEKGDYAVTSIKDSGRIPLSVAGDTLHIYDNTEYSVRFAANNALKMFTDFLADNIFLVCFFAFAALFYKKVIIPRFASDVRRK